MTDIATVSLKDMMEHPQLKGRMISGTASTAPPSYLVFARNGMMGLSLRIEGVHQGAKYGKAGTMYLPIRIRSSSVEALFKEEDAKAGVTNFPTTPVKAWPNIEFPTVRDNSASTIIAKYVPGTIQNDPQVLSNELVDKKLAKEIVKYLQTLAGPDKFTVHHRVLQDFLHAMYTEIFHKIEQFHGISKGMTEAAEAEEVGVFGNMAAKMKKKHDELVKSQENAGDVEDNDELADNEEETSEEDGDED